MNGPLFTPGPYHIEADGSELLIIGRPTWPCRRFRTLGEWEVARIDDLNGEHRNEMLANARLFAGAPLLFGFVASFAGRDMTFAKGSDRTRILEAQQLIEKVTT